MTDQWEQPTDEPGWIEPKIEDGPIYHLLKEDARIEQEI
jgi:hypothetical protein